MLSSLGVLFLLLSFTYGEDPYKFYNWTVTYGDISPLGIKQKGILINEQFPGPQINSVTNDNLIINVFNKLDEPLLITWNGILQRFKSWQDGLNGTNCPIPPGKNFTYKLQVKDQIGSYFYFPSIGFHKAVGGFGGFNIASHPKIPVPFPPPTGDFTILAGDWYTKSHKALKAILDSGKSLPFPDGLLINGHRSLGTIFTVDQGKTYRFKFSNVGLATSINFIIQGHKLLLVETERMHTIQNTYDSLDIHLGQSYSVLVTNNQPPKDYYIIVSTLFTGRKTLTTTSILHYSRSRVGISGPIPPPSTDKYNLSLVQARSISQWTKAKSPGSYHYGQIKVTRTIRLQNSALVIHGKQRYAVSSVSCLPSETPLKLADYFKILGVFKLGSIPDNPTNGRPSLVTAVMVGDFQAFYEIVFETPKPVMQSWHLDGQFLFVVELDMGEWSPNSKKTYNLKDVVARSSVQVYPKPWTAVYMPTDNVGMWNARSQDWARYSLGQQFYLRVNTNSNKTDYQDPIPNNVLLCGRAHRSINSYDINKF